MKDFDPANDDRERVKRAVIGAAQLSRGPTARRVETAWSAAADAHPLMICGWLIELRNGDFEGWTSETLRAHLTAAFKFFVDKSAYLPTLAVEYWITAIARVASVAAAYDETEALDAFADKVRELRGLPPRAWLTVVSIAALGVGKRDPMRAASWARDALKTPQIDVKDLESVQAATNAFLTLACEAAEHDPATSEQLLQRVETMLDQIAAELPAPEREYKRRGRRMTAEFLRENDAKLASAISDVWSRRSAEAQIDEGLRMFDRLRALETRSPTAAARPLRRLHQWLRTHGLDQHERNQEIEDAVAALTGSRTTAATPLTRSVTQTESRSVQTRRRRLDGRTRWRASSAPAD